MSCLVTNWTSQASVVQRRGRAGRCKPGFCFNLFSKEQFQNMSKLFWWARVGHWWEHSPPINVTWVQIPASTPYVGWVCCWFSPLLREVFLRVLRFSPLLKNQHLQIPVHPGIRATKNQLVDVLYLYIVICFIILFVTTCCFKFVCSVIFVFFGSIFWVKRRFALEVISWVANLCFYRSLPIRWNAENFTGRNCLTNKGK